MELKLKKAKKLPRFLSLSVLGLALITSVAFLLLPATSAWEYYYPNYDQSGQSYTPWISYADGQDDGDLYCYVSVAHGLQSGGCIAWVLEDDIDPTQNNELKIKIHYYRGFFAKSEAWPGNCRLKARVALFEVGVPGGLWSGYLFDFTVSGPGVMTSNLYSTKTFLTGVTVDSTKTYKIQFDYTVTCFSPLIGVSYVQRFSTSTNPSVVSIEYIAIDYY